MARVVDDVKEPTRHGVKIYEVVVNTVRYYKDGSFKITPIKHIKYPGWEEFFNEDST